MAQPPNRTKWPLWQQYLVVSAVAAAIAVLIGVAIMLRSSDELADEPIAQMRPKISVTPPRVDDAAKATDKPFRASPPALPAEPPADTGSSDAPHETQPSRPSPSPEKPEPQKAEAAPSGPTAAYRVPYKTRNAEPTVEQQGAEAAPPKSTSVDQSGVTPGGKLAGSPRAAKPNDDWLKLDEHGEPCQVTLADGTVLKLDTYGDEYEGYDYRPPMTLYDPKLQRLIDFKHVHGHGNAVSQLHFDSTNDRMYWWWGYPPHHVGRFVRADLNGQGLVDVVSELENVFGFTIDPTRKKMYWTERESLVDSVKSANLDGSGIQQIVPGAEGGGIAVEPASGDVFYWTHEGSLKYCINRIKSDGSGENEVLNDRYVVGSARHLIVEPASRKLYWQTHDGSIRRANYDGSEAEFVIDAVGTGGSTFALDMGDDELHRALSSPSFGPPVGTIISAPAAVRKSWATATCSMPSSPARSIISTFCVMNVDFA